MATIPKGNQAEVYVAVDSSITLTPGSGGTIEFDCSTPAGATRPVGRIVYAAETISVPGGSTVFARAVTVDAAYSLSSVSGGGAFADALAPGNMCIIGDSIAQQNSNILGDGTSNYMSRGPITWMSMILGWPWEWQPADNYAVFGTTMDVIIAGQLPLVLAAQAAGANYKIAFVSCGTNDTNADVPLSTIKTQIDTIFDTLLNVGIVPVHVGIRPRGNDASLTTRKQANHHINEYLYKKFLDRKCIFIDVGAAHADNSTAFGNMLTANAYDSPPLHPNTWGAYYEGQQLASWFQDRGVRPNIHFANRQADVFDRTNNPTGVAFNLPNPLLQGGTTAPSGMATTGGVWSKVSRTLPNGQTRSDPSCVMAASTLHHLYDDWIGTGAWSAAQLQPGDIIEARAQISITSGVNLALTQLRLSETDGVTSRSRYCAAAQDVLLPPMAAQTLYLKTPRHTINPYAGSGNVNVFSRVEVQTAAAGAGTFAVQQLELRKLP